MWSCNTTVKASYLFVFLYSSLLFMQPGCCSPPALRWGQGCLVAPRLGTDRQPEALALGQGPCKERTITWNFTHRQWYQFMSPEGEELCGLLQPPVFSLCSGTGRFLCHGSKVGGGAGGCSVHQSMCISTGDFVLPWSEYFFWLHRSIRGCSPRNECIIWISSVRV